MNSLAHPDVHGRRCFADVTAAEYGLSAKRAAVE